MNILIFSHFAGSPEQGMVHRNYAWAREWVRQGHEVTIVASRFSHLRRIQPETQGRVTKGVIDGIQYLWLWGPAYNQASRLARVVSMFVFALQCQFLRLPIGCGYDLVVCSSPHPFSIYPARKYARRFGAKLIFDVRDLWPMTLQYLGGLSRRNPLIWLMQIAEDYACRNADLITSVPRNAGEYFRSRGMRDGRFLHVGNGAMWNDKPEATLPDECLHVLGRLKAEGCFVLGYAGAMGVANAMHVAVEALTHAAPNVCLVAVGDGDGKAGLQELARKRGVADRVFLLPPIGRTQIPAFLERVDGTFAATRYSPLYKYGASLTKLNDYMMAAKPIIYAVGDPDNPVAVSGCGFDCAAESIPEVASALNHLVSMSQDERRQMGIRGRQWCEENQLVEKQVAAILRALEEE